MAKPSKQQGEGREQTQPAEEWGDRVATGRAIARGGKNAGKVPGATAQPTARPESVTPPTPSGESDSEAVRKTRAVADALTQLGEDADPKRVAEAVRVQAGLALEPGEVATIMAGLRDRT